MLDTNKCGNCGSENSLQAKYCRNCGEPILSASQAAAIVPDQEEIVCESCNSSNPTDAVYCGNCGRPLRQAMVGNKKSYSKLLWLSLLLILILGGISISFLLNDNDPQTESSSVLAGYADNTLATETFEASSLSSQTENVSESRPDSTSAPAVTSSALATEVTTLNATPMALPTETLVPIPTVSRTPAPTVTTTPLPTVTSAPSPTTPLEQCSVTISDRWSPFWAQYRTRLGCAVGAENRPESAVQYYERGIAIWRGDLHRIYFLYNNDTYDVYRDDAPPSGYFHSSLLKGAFGYYWNNDSGLRDRLGDPLAAEFNASNFIIQDFNNGVVLQFDDNGTDLYALFSNEGSWVRLD